MKRYFFALSAAFACLWACDVKPAEEEIANTGAANFTASFECPAGMTALWEAGDKLVVIDSKNHLHRFGLDAGAEKPAGEFSGTISEESSVAYVVYSGDPSAVDYNPETGVFTMEVPSAYNAKEAGALVKANAAAVGTLQGSEVALKSVCGFIKFTLEPNGKTLEQGGRTYNLTDIREVTFTDADGKSFAGKVHAKWADSGAPAYIDVEDGASSITFRTRTVNTPEGDIYYEAGDYYIPVIPQNYEHVSISVEDIDGNEATAVEDRAIDVQAAVLSDLRAVSWPTVVLQVNFESNTKPESDAHVDVNKFASANLSTDRREIGNLDNLVEGVTKKKTEYVINEGGQEYVFWTTNGIGRNTKGIGNNTYVLIDVIFNPYAASWARDGKNWVVGTQQEVAWIKFPAVDGVLTRVEVYHYDNGCGAYSISSAVDPETGLGTENLVAGQISTKSGAFKWLDLRIPDAERGKQYYFVMGPGAHYRIRGWKLTYKTFK